ncbi:MAG: sodium:proton antiporter, partial [Clostridia bacterium]|nr:sodium:proton antiporter [Clostridia bacterium]
WLPFAHGGATTASSSILSGLVLKAYIVLLIKIFYSVFSIELVRTLNVTNIMFIFGIGGMIYASLKAMHEEHIKRMLAYSSVAQIGYVFMGMGLGSDVGMTAAVYQIIVHAVTKPLLFASASRLSEVQGHEKSLYRLRGSARTSKLSGIAFTLGALSMVGIPLLGGFMAKYMFAEAAVMLNPNKQWFTLIALAASSVLNALYYIPAVIAIWTPSEFMVKGEKKKNTAYNIAAPILMALIVIMGICCIPVSEVINTGLSLLGGTAI